MQKIRQINFDLRWKASIITDPIKKSVKVNSLILNIQFI